MDRGAWRATVHRVAKSQTRLKRLSMHARTYVCIIKSVAVYLKLTQYNSLVAQRVKCLPGMQETWVQSLGQEDPLEKEMATHSSILAWKIPWREEPGRL